MGPCSLRRGGGPLIAVAFAALGLGAPSALAAVSYQGGSAAALTKNRTSLTLSKPSTVGPGDLLTAVIAAAPSSTSITAPTGWTQRSDGNAGADAKVAAYTHVAGSSEPSGYSWKFSASGKHVGALAEYAGVDTADPIGAVLGQSNDPSTLVTCPSVTSSVANAVLLCLVGQPNGSLFSYPSGMSPRQQTRTGSTATDRAVGIGDELRAASGETGIRTVNTSGAPADASVGVSMLLRPAVEAAPPPPPPPTSSVFFTGDFETGDLSQWSAVQRVAADRILVGQEFVRQGSHSARFTVKPGDCWKNASGTCSDRAEVHTNTNGQLHFTEGQDRYLGWSTRFNPDWPDSTLWAIFLQLHSGSGSPPVAMEVNNGILYVRFYDGSVYSKGTGVPFVKGTWHDFVLRVKFSSDPTVGFAEAWHNGVKFQERRYLATMPYAYDYLKMGIYTSTSYSVDRQLWHDGMRVGSTYDSVRP